MLEWKEINLLRVVILIDIHPRRQSQIGPNRIVPYSVRPFCRRRVEDSTGYTCRYSEKSRATYLTEFTLRRHDVGLFLALSDGVRDLIDHLFDRTTGQPIMDKNNLFPCGIHEAQRL